MCGIAGILSKKSELPDIQQRLSHFQKILKHRGPNDEGIHIDSTFGCAHVRLSIVDIAGGQQPMYTNDSKKTGIVYNGEIYNYKELRYLLIQKGYKFTTESDTEVVLKLYEAFGVDSFEMLNGMFAFCIWDNTINSIYLVRDPMGIKPLYIYEDNDVLIFSSELKAILSVPNVNLSFDIQGFQDYLLFRYNHAPHTLFKNIYRLSAGDYIEFKNMRASLHKYWNVSYNPDNTASVEDFKEEILYTLDFVIKSQLMGEVPIGTLLSGGIDSSIISYFIYKNKANLKTFNIGYPEVNEFEFSREIAQKFELDHIEVLTTPDTFIRDFHKIALHLDEPLADPACFPLYVLCEELKKHVTVVLSGEGGDELFAGYPQYDKTIKTPGNSKWKFSSFLANSHYYLNFSTFLKEKGDFEATQRYQEYFEKNGPLNGMMAYDLKTWVPEDLMMKTDKIMMAHSIEGRFPFLDKRIIELAHRIPEQYKLNGNITKWILKEAIKGKIPEKIINRPKMGFTVPVATMLERMKPIILETFYEASSSSLRDILDIEEMISHATKYYAKNKLIPPMQVWTNFILLYWFIRIFPEFKRL
jgi:asparagine synthase (glutamine-hydrolysing)